MEVKSMKIILDLHGVANKRAGKLNFAYNITKELLKDKENEYEVFTDKSLSRFISYPKNFNEKVFPKNFHYKVLKELKKNEADFYFTPTSFIVPCFFPREIKTKLIITVHDLVAFLFPEGHKKKSVILEKLLLPRALKKSTGVVVVSENTKKDLLNLIKKKNIMKKGRGLEIKIISNAADKRFFEKEKKEEFLRVQEKYQLPKNFILSVGTLEPRKNMINLIKAFFLLPEKIKKDFSLVLVGAKGWKYEKIFKEAQVDGGWGLRDERWKSATLSQKICHSSPVHFLKYVSDEDLPTIYRLARVFAFPSFYEGFGIPILESFASLTPVLSSNTSSMPEVAGEAACFISPSDLQGISQSLEKIISDKVYADSLVKKGEIQVEKFSWERSARNLISFFEELR